MIVISLEEIGSEHDTEIYFLSYYWKVIKRNADIMSRQTGESYVPIYRSRVTGLLSSSVKHSLTAKRELYLILSLFLRAFHSVEFLLLFQAVKFWLKSRQNDQLAKWFGLWCNLFVCSAIELMHYCSVYLFNCFKWMFWWNDLHI